MKWVKVGNIAGKRGEAGKDADAEAIAEDVLARVIKALDAIPRPKDGEPGKDADAEAITQDVLAEVLKAIPVVKDGKDGADANAEAIAADVLERVAKAMPTPKEGLPGKDAPPVDIESVVDRVISRIPKPENGKDADPLFIREEIARAVDLIPRPNDGKSFSLEDARPILEGQVAKWALDFERRATDILQRSIDRMPAPKNGENGKDGADGFALDDVTVETKDDGRVLGFTFKSGDRQIVRELQQEVILDRGVFASGRVYEKGDSFTYAGSMWITQRQSAPTERPGDDSGAFRLAVKRGKDGKDGTNA